MATTVGEAVVRLTFDGSSVKASLNKTSSQVESAGKSSGTAWANAWVVAAGNLISSGISKITSAISSGFSYATRRLDTLNKFPIAMRNLGISADEASQGIKTLAEYTLGLPTTLNDAAEKVQLFTASTGDVNKSIKIFEALNDAVISGAQSTEVQATAIYQWSQAIARGSFDLEREYMAMVDANAAAVNQVSKQLLGTEADFNSLWEALKDNTVTVEDVINAMIELDEKGNGVLQSWHDNARDASAGIDVALTRLYTNIGKAIAAVIEDTIGWKNLYTVINNIGDGIYVIGKNIGKFLKDIWPYVMEIFNFLNDNQWIIGFLVAVATALAVVNAVLDASPITWIVLAVSTLAAGIILLMNHLEEVQYWIDTNLPWLSEMLSKIGGILEKIGVFVGKVADIAKRLFTALWPLIEKLLALLGVVIEWLVERLGTAISTIIDVVSVAFGIVFALWDKIFKVAGNVLGGIATVVNNVTEGIISFFKWMGDVINSVFNGAAESAEGFANSFGDTIGGIISNIAAFFEWIYEKVTEVVSFVIDYISVRIAPLVDFVKNLVLAILAILFTISEWIYNYVLAPIIAMVTGAVSFVVKVVQEFVGVIAGIIGEIAKAIGTAVEFVKNVIGAVVGWINDNVITPIANFFNGLFNGVQKGASDTANGISDVFGGIVNWIYENVIKRIEEFFVGLWNGIIRGFEAVKDGIGRIFETVGGIIKVPINGVIHGINSVLQAINSITIPDWVPFIGGAHSDFGMIPYLAEGGYAEGATPAIIGEQGKEVVLPLEQNTDNWAGLLADTLFEKMYDEDDEDSLAQQPVIINLNVDGEIFQQLILKDIRRTA